MTFDCFIENLLLEKQLSPAPRQKQKLSDKRKRVAEVKTAISKDRLRCRSVFVCFSKSKSTKTSERKEKISW